MTDSGIRSLVLTVAGAVLVCLADSASSGAAEVVQANFTVKIVAGGTEASSGEASGIEIAPFGQTEDENDVPILVAPAYNEEPEAKKAAKKPSKPGAKKSDKSPVATESGSRKARAEWEKKRAAESRKRKPKSQTSAKSDKSKAEKGESDKSADDDRPKSAASTAAKAALAAKKRAMMAAADAKVAKSTKTVVAADCPPARAQIDFHRYREIYRSIPFSRAEYDWNPRYRHQATMEIIIGQLHPVIVAPAAPVRARPQPRMGRSVTIRFLPIIRPGYRSYSRYPWH
jgi:hypothetical protein